MTWSITAGTSSSSWVPTIRNLTAPEKAAANNNGKEKDAATSARTVSGTKATTGIMTALQARRVARKDGKERRAPKARKERKEGRVIALRLRQTGHQTGPLPFGERQSASNTTRTGRASMATTAGLTTIIAYRKRQMANLAGPLSTKVRTAISPQRRGLDLDYIQKNPPGNRRNLWWYPETKKSKTKLDCRMWLLLTLQKKP